MKAKKLNVQEDDLRPEYDFDFSKAERGRYANRLKTEGSNLVLIEPELAKSFPDSASINAALRTIIEFAQRSADLTQHSGTSGGRSWTLVVPEQTNDHIDWRSFSGRLNGSPNFNADPVEIQRKMRAELI